MRKLRFYTFFFFLASRLFSQSLNFINYTVEDGLPYIQIYDIFQDDKGYLWTGGYGGLSSFDGKEFTNYNPRKGLVHFWVTSIRQDSAKNLVIGTLNGLSIFNGKKFTNYNKASGLVHNSVTSLAVKSNEVAVATQGGISYLKNGRIRSDNRFKGLNITHIRSRNKNYIASSAGSLFFFNEKILKTICSFSVDTLITSFEADRNSTLWIGTNKGLFFIENFDLKHEEDLTVTFTGIRDNISALYADAKNNLWAGTSKGLIKYFNRTALRYAVSKEENANDILSLTADYEENIWIGTRSGLFKFRDEGFVYYGLEDGLKSGFIQSIVNDKQNTLWISTLAGGIYKQEKDSFINYTTKNGLANNSVPAMAVDVKNRLWLGTTAGLCIKVNERITPAPFLKDEEIHFIYAGKADKICMGTTRFIYIKNASKYPDCAVESFEMPYPPNIGQPQLGSACEGENGNIYIASFLGGLFCFNGSEIKDVTTTCHLPTRAVLDVKFRDGYLFVATLEGIYILNTETKSTEKITEEDGLSSNLVYSLLLTDNGQTLWAGTNQGANKIDLQSFFSSHVKNILSFGKTEGFKGLECNTGALCTDSAGSVWFGTVNGVVKHNPVKYIPNDNEARLSFRSLRLFYDDTNLLQNAELDYKLNNIGFSFIGVCLTNPDKVFYIHKLEGFDRSWSPPTQERDVRYSNLPPGNYVFKVRCCNNQGVWNTEPLSYSFSVDYPYWQRWWFILGSILMAGGIVTLVFRIRLNQLKREQEKESRTQVEIAKNELKALRAQMNPHFLFNSLNSIQHFILNNKSEEAAFYLNRFARLMRMILSNSEKTAVRLNEEIDALRIYIELEKMRFNNLFDYEIVIDKSINADYEQIPTLLLQPYVENAILHGLVPKNEKGFLKIDFYLRHNFIHAVIEDNGIGRKRSGEIRKASHKSHESMGTKITGDRLRLLSHLQQQDYTIKIIDLRDHSGNPQGTRVEISWPA